MGMQIYYVHFLPEYLIQQRLSSPDKDVIIITNFQKKR